MKFATVYFLFALFGLTNAFAPAPANSMHRGLTAVGMAKYNKMDEILALFPDDKPVLVNFYDAATENEIKNDIFRAKKLLEGRATIVSIKRQDYPELAKLWDCHEITPSMILFKDGNPATRIYGESHYLEIVATVGKFCDTD
mmetsp:Transcript_16391/g.21453  ORF Transcript_16391/g.21453 Transcript_16391/m.21453 type:complete len:142 (-) Transcript_16391:310-735(-)|eukprot:CAMPEP_0198138124 /NCGR_PEP_ID=MMETSP1443-20131203/1539_1 /TAXON_ID=186043 /ORGANISM="Entomoneis sp., Strain CCMP2396" /LENGTH=141 /DNA_ID=CAMNT_0043799767 /DNA_START=146 /DNA_END=571 /DNA_ORIENTATION=-